MSKIFRCKIENFTNPWVRLEFVLQFKWILKDAKRWNGIQRNKQKEATQMGREGHFCWKYEILKFLNIILSEILSIYYKFHIGSGGM